MEIDIHIVIEIGVVVVVYSDQENCTVLYCTVLCCTVLYCTVLYCTVHSLSINSCALIPFCLTLPHQKLT